MKVTIIIFACIAVSLSAFSQSKTKEDLKRIVLQETEAYMKGDSINWSSVFNHGEQVFRVYSGNGFHSSQTGWKNFAPYFIEWMREGPIRKEPIRIEQDNYLFRISPDLCWMSYRQQIFYRDRDSLPFTNTIETRTLAREQSTWKIVSIITLDSLSYSSVRPTHMENLFNNTGYTYLAANKIKEAIEVFKLNVTLFPDAWNVYDSLGEAYAADGNKEMAIKNYERSVQLNPKNDSGVANLKKLKEE